MLNVYAFKIKFLPPTNFSGDRVAISVFSENKPVGIKRREIISYDYRFSTSAEVAEVYLKNKYPNLVLLNKINHPDFYIFTFDISAEGSK